MKKNFFTGLLLLLPFTLTVLIVVWVVNFLTDPFQSSVENVLYYFIPQHQPFVFFPGLPMLHLVSKILVIALLTCFLILVGYLGQGVLLTSVLNFGDFLISRIPFINKIHYSIKELVDTLFKSKGSAFTQVVVVPFPNAKSYTVALITQAQKMQLPSSLVTVFVPGTPNPTCGFMLTCKYEDVIFLDMKVEEGLKFIVSCGTMFHGFQISKP